MTAGAASSPAAPDTVRAESPTVIDSAWSKTNSAPASVACCSTSAPRSAPEIESGKPGKLLDLLHVQDLATDEHIGHHHRLQTETGGEGGRGQRGDAPAHDDYVDLAHQRFTPSVMVPAGSGVPGALRGLARSETGQHPIDLRRIRQVIDPEDRQAPEGEPHGPARGSRPAPGWTPGAPPSRTGSPRSPGGPPWPGST